MSISVLLYKPSHMTGKLTELDGLSEMQAAVSGYLELLPLHVVLGSISCDRALALICNEEGAIKGMPHNRHGIVGPFFITRVDGSDFVSLTEADISAVRDFLDGTNADSAN